MQINLREVKESFIATSRDILQKAEGVLLEMERGTDANHFAELLRAIHTIKGNAGIFELKPLIQLCHAFETRFTAIQSRGEAPATEVIDMGLTAIDRMRAVVAAMERSLWHWRWPPSPRRATPTWIPRPSGRWRRRRSLISSSGEP